MKAETGCVIINSVLYVSIAVMVLGLYSMGAGTSSLWPLCLVMATASTSKE